MIRILSLIPLIFMIFSDFRKREIDVFPLGCFALMQTGAVLFYDTHEVLLRRLAINNLFITGAGVILWLYIKKRFGKPEKAFGSGDLFFFISLTPAFDFREFLWFITVAFVITLAAWALWNVAITKTPTIPLVSTVGICYIVHFLKLLIVNY